jgi:hypothetical protein
MLARGGFLLPYHHFGVGEAAFELDGGRQAHKAATDDAESFFSHWGNRCKDRLGQAAALGAHTGGKELA